MDKKYQYQYIQFNEIENSTSSGLIKLSRKIVEGGEFIPFRNGNKFIYTLISNVGIPKYKCSGSCYCEEEEMRKSLVASSSIYRGLFYFVAAITSSIAVFRAKEYFSEECVSQLRDVCYLSSIKSKIDDCEIVSDGENSWEKVAKENLKEKTYWCMGDCMENKFLAERVHPFLMMEFAKRAKSLECSKLTLMRHVKAYTPKEAKMQFMQGELYEFCMFSSRCEASTPHGIEHGNLCVAFVHCDMGNPTILCKDMEEEDLDTLFSKP